MYQMTSTLMSLTAQGSITILDPFPLSLKQNRYGVVDLPGEMDDDEGGVRWCNADVVPEPYQRIPDWPAKVGP